MAANVWELTEFEERQLILVACGLSDREVAREMGITYRTARFRTGIILGKLQVSNRFDAAFYAWRTGLVPIDEAWAVVEAMQWGYAP